MPCRHVPRGWTVVAVGLAGLGALMNGGCGRTDAAPTPPPSAVTVSHPLYREVIEWDEYTGHLEAPESVNVAARVSGFIEESHFQEGAIVKKDDVLFVIDDRQFKADLNSKVADVAKAQSQADLALIHLNRFEKVHGTKAISEEDYDTAKASYDQCLSVLASAKAAAEVSRLNLEWTRVVAPITGRVSRMEVTPGNLINGGVGQATLLTTIVSIDPMYCYVDVDEHSILKYQELARQKKRISARDARIPVFMQLGNETGFPHEGVVDFVDNKFDPTTGTLRARGVFPNPDKTLTPGSFGRVRVAGSGRYQAMLIPDAAVGTDQDLKFVMLATANDTVEMRPVKLGALFGRLRAVEGISVDDRVIINGIQRARPGSQVTVQVSQIPDSAYMMTAPGSPTTRALPATTVPTSGPPERAAQ
ncbi:MAG TPA: efflux RND transporter periplasmic adaptor subunit [Tepidisphaeraceae bacterium]|nr:efflux RND transporter periplasmic adaptor subunit [Tepidisphaeraceae bacterium]